MQVLPDGNLELKTPYGLIEEKGLRAYQQAGASINQVPCRMMIDNNIIRFDLGAYDSSRPVVIDPLVFSTYLGGSTLDQINAVKINSGKDIVVTGGSSSSDFPTTTGAYQTTLKGSSNVFVSKFNPTCTTLLASTYLGGSGAGPGDFANALALDSLGNAVVAGQTGSTNFPTTTGAFQATNPIDGALSTSFVSKISSDGTKLLASSYLGGTSGGTGDQANAVAVDSSGNFVVVGNASSTGFPMPNTAYQKSLLGPKACYIVKLSSDAKTLVAGTYLGGSGDVAGNGDGGQAVALDASQNIAVAGYANSSNFPVSTGAFQATNKSFLDGFSNAFFAKVSSNCKSLLASTFLGGGGGDSAFAIALDGSANAIIWRYYKVARLSADERRVPNIPNGIKWRNGFCRQSQRRRQDPHEQLLPRWQ